MPVYMHMNTYAYGIHMQNLKEILDNLPHTLPYANINTYTRTHTYPVPPPSALSGTSLNIHHSGCSVSAVNAASHSRE